MIEKDHIFGDRLNKVLKSRGMTQRMLADKVGITEITVSRYMNGTRVPKVNIIRNMAEVLNVSTDYLLGISDKKGFSLWSADEDGVWACHTCGLLWTFIDGGVKENEMNYCPKCGKKIITEVRNGK